METPTVSAHAPRNLAADPQIEPQALGPRLRSGERTSPIDRLVEVEVGDVEFEMAGFDLRDVEDVVDDREHLLARARDLLRTCPVALGHVLAEAHPTLAFAKHEIVTGDLDVDDRPVLAAVPPRACVLEPQSLTAVDPRVFEHRGVVLLGRDVKKGDRQEFLTGVAGVGNRSVGDGDDPQRLAVIGQHRLWIPLEQQAMLLRPPVELLTSLHQLGHRAVTFRHVLAEHEPTAATPELQVVAGDLDVDDAAALASMTPRPAHEPGTLAAQVGRKERFHQLEIFGGGEISEREGDELVPRVAAAGHGGVAHGDDAERLSLVHHHR
jgi:hypothetical protein